MSLDIVFVHGMFMSPRSWDAWSAFFRARGHRCHAPPWPFHDGDPAALRASPPEGVGKLTLGEVVAAMERHVDALGAKPVVIGATARRLASSRPRSTKGASKGPTRGFARSSMGGDCVRCRGVRTRRQWAKRAMGSRAS